MIFPQLLVLVENLLVHIETISWWSTKNVHNMSLPGVVTVLDNGYKEGTRWVPKIIMKPPKLVEPQHRYGDDFSTLLDKR